MVRKENFPNLKLAEIIKLSINHFNNGLKEVRLMTRIKEKHQNKVIRGSIVGSC